MTIAVTRVKTGGAGGFGLRVREDVEELDVEAVRRQPRDLGDPVLLLEAEQQLGPRVVGAVELVEPEEERRRLLAGDEEQARLDVVRAVELVTLAQRELPALARRDPVFDRGGLDGEILVDLDLDGCVGPLGGRVSWLNLKGCHGRAVPGAGRMQT